MGGEDALTDHVQEKVMLVGRMLGGVFYAGGNGLGLLCCSCLFSSGKQLRAVLASCLCGVSRALPQAPVMSEQIAGSHTERD